MLPYKTLIRMDREAGAALYVQLCNAFIALITKGILEPADMLPSSRVLAGLVGVNRNTVKLAYEELVSQGWAESVERKGIFVNAKLPVPATSALAGARTDEGARGAFEWTNRFRNAMPSKDLQKVGLAIDDGFPDVRLAPIDELMREYRSLSRRYYGKSFLRYGSSAGSERLRVSIAGYLSHTRGVNASPDDVLITKGSQMGIYLAAQLLLGPGDTVAAGMSNYALADETFRHAGADMLRIPVDASGMDIDFLEKCLEKTKIKAVYIIPHHHLPTTVTLSSERRLKLLNLAKIHHFAIIEDDYDFDFHYDNKPYLPLASIDHNQNVIYIGSISKTFAPALRIGFMVGPHEFIKAAASLRELIDRQGDTLMEEAFSVLYDNGEVDRHFRKSLKIYKDRRDMFCEILASDFVNEITFNVPEGGLGIWTVLSPAIDLHKMSVEARKKGLYIDDGDFYKNESFSANALRMGFASLNEQEMRQALQILKSVLSNFS
ncbi:GntR family transcriptional regulator / MocR family aminotransferase [Dyadobacter sp. SG02]|uniref:MocR-like pyridoxine biosynthesis transcription factor PdxR n=1 Tax=Dyadobacter sp. SG02 TaxID=1855291 RepID=UPI0008C5F131|nr:PLP-dependent aminotransferase family protein [Dyadobacter sp. SG02]SEJ58802.1 GntR family transcriptional regulator / MocR family aminotransferase [Dyadobacter sp. SG02]